MYMSYSKNPHLPRVRMEAVILVRRGWSMRKVARHMGFHHTAIMKWMKKAPFDGRQTIPTRSSRPHRHPNSLSMGIIDAIKTYRRKRERCSEVIHEELRRHGIIVSLSSVKRTLSRAGMLRKRSPWKRIHITEPRPEATSAGNLVQIDTIHIVPLIGKRFYVYTLIDVASRWAYAEISERINTHRSFQFVKRAQKYSSFQFKMIQSDNGSEFSTWFTEHIQKLGMKHRHSRVRQSNDNAHVERFNRTVQDECFINILEEFSRYRKALKAYLPYYNNERLHLGLNLLTPSQVVPSY